MHQYPKTITSASNSIHFLDDTSDLGRVRDEIFARVVVEFGRSVSVECAPVVLVPWLAVQTSACRLPWLIESLEVEYVEVPVKSSTDSLLPEIVSFLGASSSSSVIGSTYEMISVPLVCDETHSYQW